MTKIGTLDKIEMLELIDSAIVRLQEVKTLLQETGMSIHSVNSTALIRRPITPEGRSKIAAAQKARWKKVKEAMKQ